MLDAGSAISFWSGIDSLPLPGSESSAANGTTIRWRAEALTAGVIAAVYFSSGLGGSLRY